MANTIAEKLKLEAEMDMAQPIQAVDDLADKTGDATGKMTALWLAVGDAIKSGVSAMWELGKATAKATFELEESAAAVATLIDGDADHKVKLLTDQMLRLAQVMGKDPVELAEGLYDAISAGIPPVIAKTEEFMSTITKASVAGRSTVKESVGAIVSVLNAYDLEMTEAARISDIYFTIVKRGITTFPELAAATARFTGIAKAANIAIEDWAAAYASLTAKKFSTQRATTSLTAVVKSIIKPTAQASAMMKKYKFDLSAAALSSKGLIGVLKDMRDKMPMTAENINEVFSNQIAASAVLALASTDKSFAKFEENIKAMQTSAGATSVAFNKMANTTAHQMRVMEQRINVAATTLMMELKPAILAVMNALTENTKGSLTFVRTYKAVNKTLNTVALMWNGLWLTIRTVASGIYKAISAVTFVFQTVWMIAKQAYQSVKTFFNGIATVVWTVLKYIIKSITQFIDAIASMGIGIAAAPLKALLKVLKPIDRFIQDTHAKSLSITKKSASNHKTIMKDYVKSLKNDFFDVTARSIDRDAAKNLQNMSNIWNRRGNERLSREELKIFMTNSDKMLDGKKNRNKNILRKDKELYDKQAQLRREATFKAEMQRKMIVENTTNYLKNIYRERTRDYVKELKERTKKSEQFTKKIQDIENRAKMQAESFEQRAFDIKSAGLTAEGKRRRRFDFAETYLSRGITAKKKGDLKDALRLFEKAQSIFTSVGTQDSDGDLSKRSLASLERTQKQVTEVFAMQKKEAKNEFVKNKVRIEELQKSLVTLQKSAIIKLKVLIDNKEAVETIDKFRQSMKNAISPAKELLGNKFDVEKQFSRSNFPVLKREISQSAGIMSDKKQDTNVTNNTVNNININVSSPDPNRAATQVANKLDKVTTIKAGKNQTLIKRNQKAIVK